MTSTQVSEWPKYVRCSVTVSSQGGILPPRIQKISVVSNKTKCSNITGTQSTKLTLAADPCNRTIFTKSSIITRRLLSSKTSHQPYTSWLAQEPYEAPVSTPSISIHPSPHPQLLQISNSWPTDFFHKLKK